MTRNRCYTKRKKHYISKATNKHKTYVYRHTKPAYIKSQEWKLNKGYKKPVELYSITRKYKTPTGYGIVGLTMCSNGIRFSDGTRITTKRY